MAVCPQQSGHPLCASVSVCKDGQTTGCLLGSDKLGSHVGASSARSSPQFSVLTSTLGGTSAP